MLEQCCKYTTPSSWNADSFYWYTLSIVSGVSDM